MTGAVPPTSSTTKTTTAQDIPLSNKSIDMANLPSFEVLIEDYQRITKEFNNHVMKLAESRRPRRYNVIDIITSRTYLRGSEAKENAPNFPFFTTASFLFQKRINPMCWRSPSFTLITAQALMFLGNLRGYFSQRGQR
ncbi:MAG TPA: hypothetical protein VFU89_05780 [Rhabdochlamydiaceae bacterium]|nr:hypothetical protein [Rhabdochlamydiaceae bacterium]